MATDCPILKNRVIFLYRHVDKQGILNYTCMYQAQDVVNERHGETIFCTVCYKVMGAAKTCRASLPEGLAVVSVERDGKNEQ